MAESRFVTSEMNIRGMLRRCDKCTVITNNARLIMPHNELRNLRLTSIASKKHSIIINSECDNQRLGHWFTLLVFPNRHAIICDGLNETFQQRDILMNLKIFCRNNNLVLHNLGFRCQQTTSKKCGYISLFFTAKASTLSYFSFMKLIHMLNHGSINSKEQYIMQFVAKHFSIPFY